MTSKPTRERGGVESCVNGCSAPDGGDPNYPGMCAICAWRSFAKSADPDGFWSGWIGPCAHGRDPWTRCDICGELTKEEAQALAEAPGFDANGSPA